MKQVEKRQRNRSARRQTKSGEPVDREFGGFWDAAGCLVDLLGCFFPLVVVILCGVGLSITGAHIITWLGRR